MSTLKKLTQSVESRGYTILKIDASTDKVLVHMPNNKATEYVIWTYNEEGDTFWGHYFSDYRSAEDYFEEVTHKY